MFFVDDDQAQILEPDLALQQALGRDDDVDGSAGHAREHRLCLLVGPESREACDANRPIGESIRERRQMLLCEQGRGHQDGDLLAGLNRDERGAQRHLGLAEAHVAANHPVHGFVPDLEIAQYLFDGRGLVGGLLEAEA